MPEYTVIITAGGLGSRMNSVLPKQFLEINGEPILMKTIKRFYQFDHSIQIIITLPAEWFEYWNELVKKINFQIPFYLVEGGEERFDSIKNTLSVCKGKYIAVHDGVRPFVSNNTIKKLFDKVKEFKAVIPVVKPKDSLRKITENGSLAVRRDDYLLVQTPQVFESNLLKQAYEQTYQSFFTDDASVVEHFGCKVKTILGNYENIKVTEPIDLIIAQEIDRLF